MTLLENQDHEWLNSRIEAYLDGDLSESDRVRFELLMEAEKTIWEDVNLANQIVATLRNVRDEACPDYVLAGVMSHVRSDLRRSAWAQVQSFFLRLNAAHLKPAFAVVVLFLMVFTSTQIGKPAKESPMAVAQALDDVKWTLAFLSEAGRTTGSTVKSDVIEDQVVGPMSRNFPSKSEN